MNASCALHHFCELHGPQTLLCTEGRTYIHDFSDHDNEDLKTYHSQLVRSESSEGKVPCQSCTLSAEKVLISTMDFSHHMEYVSSPSTTNQELFKNVRHTCVRSFTSEISTERGYPVLLGDDESGYCVSLNFPCKDFHARGHQRLYSLCYLSHDKYHLLAVMGLISKCLRQIACWLQCDADQTYESEAQIEVETNVNGTVTTIHLYHSPSCVPSQRMLSDIVRDSKLMYRVHALFVWMLRAANSAIQESLCDGLPMVEQERTDIVGDEQKARDQLDMTLESTYSTTDDNDNIIKSDCSENDDYDSLEYHFTSYGHQALRLFRAFVQRLNNRDSLQYILHNWLIGNQLIIKFSNRTDSKDLLRALASVFRLLLPDGCCCLIEATNHVASCIANLVLHDMDATEATGECRGNTENNSITIRILLDDSGEHIREAELETRSLLKSDLRSPTYVKTIVELFTDNGLDDETFEAILTREKAKYLNKAKVYFQLGRCQTVSTVPLTERQQMNILRIVNPTDLLIVRFWQKGLSHVYKRQIRRLKQDDNRQRKSEMT